MVAYLDAALEERDLGLIAALLGDIARAKGMKDVAAATGLVGRASTSPSRPTATPPSAP